MIFLIEYDRVTGQLVRMDHFDDAQRSLSEDRRLSLEIENFQAGVSREVVLLEAATESDLRRTHRRYFEGIEDLARMPSNDA